MSKQNQPPRLLASELEILEMLWRVGSATIVEAQRALPGEVGYTTVQTRLNRMVKKGLVKRSRSKPAKYSAGVSSDDVTSGDLNLLVEKVSRGRIVPLVAHLVRERSLSTAEIEELKQLILEAEGRTKSNRQKRGEL